jgi:hypothetical protein
MGWTKGRPNFGKRRPLAERFWEKVDKNAPGGCWTWMGALRHGHGTIHVALPKQVDYTHRVVFRLLGREIPGGLEVDHVCRNRACCNPDHLRFVTHGQNSQENSVSPFALNKAKTHCKRGHALEGENLGLYVRADLKHPTRICLTCYPTYWRWAAIPRTPPPGARKLRRDARPVLQQQNVKGSGQ